MKLPTPPTDPLDQIIIAIFTAIAETEGVPLEEMMAHHGKHTVCGHRQLALWLISEVTLTNNCEIARRLDTPRDLVQYSLTQVANRLSTDADLRAAAESLAANFTDQYADLHTVPIGRL